jgi:hypothetical protein
VSSLVTYPCSDCRWNRQDRETGTWSCRSENYTCERYCEVARIEEFLYEAIDLFGHRHFSDETRAEIANGMVAGFQLALVSQDGALDEAGFLHACGVRP